MDVAGINGPVGLLPPLMGGTECQMEEARKLSAIQNKIMNVAKDTIFINLREQLAPNFATSVFSTVKKITMSFKDDGGNEQKLKVLEFYNAIMRASVTFLEDETYPYNLANHFVNNLTPQLRDMFAKECQDHLTFSDLSRDGQMRQVAQYL